MTRKIIKIVLYSVLGLFVGYAVLFSIAATVALVWGISYVGRPVWDVRKLIASTPAETKYMRSCRRELAAAGSHDTLVHRFVPFDSISPHLKNAVLAAEDDGFYSHPGFDVAAILSAVEYNRFANGHKRGASTITQQLAKNLFLSGEKSYDRKYRELAYAVLMEHFLGKDRIFELYLNYAQWGKNVFGCEAAARTYYKKSCGKLSLGEAAHLAATLAMPERLSPHTVNSTFMAKRITVIANNLYRRRRLDDSAYTMLSGQPPPDTGADTSITAQPDAGTRITPPADDSSSAGERRPGRFPARRSGDRNTY